MSAGWRHSGRRVGKSCASVAAWEEAESPTHARLLARLAVALRFSDQHERRSAVAERALEMARRFGDSAVIAYALQAWHASQWEPDNLDPRVAAATELVQLAERVSDPELAFDGHAWCLDNHLELGDRQGVDAEFAVCERLSEKLRQPHYRWYTRNARVVLLTLEGQFRKAEQLVQENLSFGQNANSGAPIGFAVQMFTLSCTQGRREAFEGSAEAMGALASQFPAFPVYRCILAYIARELGQADRARLEFERLAAKQFHDVLRDQGWFLFMRQLAEVCAFLEDAERAATLARLLAPYEERAVTVISGGGYFGPVAHCLGLLETTLSRWDDATRHFEHALEMNRRMRAWPWLARTQYEYARMLLARGDTGDRDRAQAVGQEALVTAQELGMPLLIERVQALENSLRSIGDSRQESPASEEFPIADAPSAIRIPQSAIERVFRREGDYWTIVFDGTVVRLKDNKGLQYLAHLLCHPHQEFLALDLVTEKSGVSREESGVENQTIGTGHGPPSWPANSPSTNGTPKSVIPPSPMPSSTASFTTRTASC